VELSVRIPVTAEGRADPREIATTITFRGELPANFQAIIAGVQPQIDAIIKNALAGAQPASRGSAEPAAQNRSDWRTHSLRGSLPGNLRHHLARLDEFESRRDPTAGSPPLQPSSGNGR
jgi:hypothetical protein